MGCWEAEMDGFRPFFYTRALLSCLIDPSIRLPLTNGCSLLRCRSSFIIHQTPSPTTLTLPGLRHRRCFVFSPSLFASHACNNCGGARSHMPASGMTRRNPADKSRHRPSPFALLAGAAEDRLMQLEAENNATSRGLTTLVGHSSR